MSKATSVNAGVARVSHNSTAYNPDKAVFIQVEDSAWGKDYNFGALSIEQAEAIRDGLTNIIDEVKARKPKELTGSEKIAKLPNGTHFAISEGADPVFIKTGSNVTSIFGTSFARQLFDEDNNIYVNGVRV